MNKIITILTFAVAITFLVRCASDANATENKTQTSSNKVADAIITDNTSPNKGIGQYSDKTIEFSDIDESLVIAGKNTFKSKCMACHSIDTKMIGPALSGVLNRRAPEWIMNMILSPEIMTKEDPDAIALLKEYNNIPMMPLGLTDLEAREILEYLRTES